MNRGILAVISAGLVPMMTADAQGQLVASNAPALIGEGTLIDGEGHEGTWQVAASARGYNLLGTLRVRMAGRDLTLDLGAAGSYRENGRCYIRGESGRDRIELAGPCDAQPYSGSVRGFLAGSGAISGQFTGRFAANGGPLSPPNNEVVSARIAPTTAPGALSQGATASAQPKVAVGPNAGPFSGRGALRDHDGASGTWQVRGNLSGGLITGSLSVTLGERAMTVDLGLGKAYLENGFCVMKGVDGRNRFQLRGRCDQEPFAGTLNGYFDRVGEANGEFTGALTWARQPVAAAGVLPTNKLTCSYMERVGGVVAGDLGRREIRPSALGTLTLSSGGKYAARNGSGTYVRQGGTIRLTGGPWAGAVGTLLADNSGRPAVYFELDDNRRGDGSHLVDPWRTFCVTAN